jgi:uncharacterized protein (TIGR00369 family)
MTTQQADPPVPPWRNPEPGRILGRGHPAGDHLHAYDWEILEERRGYYKLSVPLADHLRNPRGQLFGGFTPTYVDLVALRTVAATRSPGEPALWLTTVNMRVDYFEPIVDARFVLECQVINQRRGTHFAEVRFLDLKGTLLAFALVVLRDAKPHAPT